MANVPRPGFVRFEELNLNVKFGPRVSTLDALNPWVVRRLFKDKVPVPEVFGWRIDDHGYVFIYMELIKGPALLEHWGLLDTAGKGAVSDQLAVLVQSLRQLEQDPSDQFIGASKPHISPAQNHSYMFAHTSHAGSINKQHL
jgi:hypothetical protein